MLAPINSDLRWLYQYVRYALICRNDRYNSLDHGRCSESEFLEEEVDSWLLLARLIWGIISMKSKSMEISIENWLFNWFRFETYLSVKMFLTSVFNFFLVSF